MAKKKSEPMGLRVEAEYTPRIYMDLDDAKLVVGLQVGQSVTMMVSGEICEITQRDRDVNGKDKIVSSLALDDYSVKIAPKNMWTEMADEDD